MMSSSLASCVVIASFAALVAVSGGQFYNPSANMGGSVGCVVTGNKLYSHGNFIRDLSAGDIKELKKYKKDMTAFKKGIEEAFANADSLAAKNATIPPMPLRPNMPAFCTKPDTVLYIFSGCTVQNYKVYIAGKFARDLGPKEKKQLDEFAKQMADKNASAAAVNGTTATTVAAPTDISKVTLDFCTEF